MSFVKCLAIPLTLAAALSWLGSASAGQNTFESGDISVENPWARASAGPARTGAAYMTIKNTGQLDDRLIGVAAGVSKKAQLHSHIKVGDIMKMRRVDSIDLKSGHATALEPGGFHVMLMGLKSPLRKGQRFPITLEFEKAGNVTVEVEVKGAGAMGHGKKH